MTTALGADMRRLVVGAASSTDHERDAVADFATFFRDDHGPVSRDDGPDHATASALVFDQTHTRTLLVFHTKGRFWVQPGGHLEPEDASIAEAALRELREETGVDVPALVEPLVYDLDHHRLSSAFGRCASHLDIGMAVVVDDDLELFVSNESEDVRWWPIEALPAQVPDGFHERVRRLRDRLMR
ncbi:NUDIX domain-containing protein [Microbacterium sp. APC 3901]|uniref:NUDIX hydrolase n=1 Tax=Microbacterium sp. APC 3901 TaxID=3035192 RepID=UPI0025B5D41A|nr:NUDIX domain-containing protein [Microbacterium sp. APC 3901]MDN3443765.1 NUDIX domain-containing protein [Microbacterium sp. APC 3901]